MRTIVSRTVEQSIPNAAYTAVFWNDEILDESGTPEAHTTGTNSERITARYGPNRTTLVMAQIRFAANATGHRRARIRKNEIGVVCEAVVEASTLSTGPINLCMATIASPGDYFTCDVFQNSGASSAAVAQSAKSAIRGIRSSLKDEALPKAPATASNNAP